ncbi:hypothetical protein EAE96_003817 [Botrytis aclada]|nr:hypothetical protein EAE96_003817 [Botrytis aclada]
MQESKSRLELLPVETIQAIQCLIENVPDLSSIILTCKTAYNAFVSADRLILKQILTNEIGFEVLPEAVLTALISRQVPVSENVLDEYYNRFKNDRNVKLKAMSELGIHDALFLSKLHSHIVYFTNDFILKAFASRFFTNNIPTTTWQLAASDKEKRRIQRTFYHFQIYSYIVYGKKLLRVRLYLDENRMFFNHFSIWENEQLACVHDYMFRIIAPGFRELVEHDVEWGAKEIEYASFGNSEDIESLIARGLFAIRNMVEAKSYEEISKAYCQNFPEYLPYSLDHGLKGSTGITEEDEWSRLKNYSKEDDDTFIKKPVWCDGDDKGPGLIWRWTHQSYYSIDFVLSDEHIFEREWGYVMWDHSRIRELRVMENEWERTEDAENERGSRPSQESLNRRRTIYHAGGRGWWTAGDESKVVWPDADIHQS